MADKKKARANLKKATARMSAADVARLTLSELGVLVKENGLSVTFLRNIQHDTVGQISHRELQDIADGIVQALKGAYPDVAAIPDRRRTIKVWLDGFPLEVTE